MSIQQFQNRLMELKGERQSYLKIIASLEIEKEYYLKRVDSFEKAKVVLQEVAKQTQQNLEKHLSGLVTLALRSVWATPPEFVLRFESRRGKTECDLLFEENGFEQKPVDGSGGGMMDVTSFALRVAFWALKKNRPIMVLDEPFPNVSPDLQYKVSEMVKFVSEKLGLQIIMVSHAENINVAANKTFVVSKKGKVGFINEEKV